MAKSHPSQQKCLLNSVLSAGHYLKIVPNLKSITENVLTKEIGSSIWTGGGRASVAVEAFLIEQRMISCYLIFKMFSIL